MIKSRFWLAFFTFVSSILFIHLSFVQPQRLVYWLILSGIANLYLIASALIGDRAEDNKDLQIVFLQRRSEMQDIVIALYRGKNASSADSQGADGKVPEMQTQTKGAGGNVPAVGEPSQTTTKSAEPAAI